MNVQTERLTLTGSAGTIEAARDAASLPDGAAPRGVAILAHPHPLFGGTMDNKVVQTLARAFTQCGWTTVRFNFRGVGASAGVHDEGRGELQDLLAVVQQVAPQGPIALAGFSFGAFVTSHALAALWGEREVAQAVARGAALQSGRAGMARMAMDRTPVAAVVAQIRRALPVLAALAEMAAAG